MKLKNTANVLGCFLFGAVSFAYGDYSTPVGIWDIQGKAKVSGRLSPSGKTTAISPKIAYGFVQFKEKEEAKHGGDYTTIPWQDTPGIWSTLKSNGKAYNVSFDLEKVSSGDTYPPFLNTMLNQYATLVKEKYNKVEKFKKIELLSYSDNGQLKQKGLYIIGTNKIKANITFTDPDTQQDITGFASMAFHYIGTRSSAPSTCCASEDPEQNKKDSDAFLAENAHLPGIQKTESGLQYRVFNKSDEQKPTPTSSDTVEVSYRGILPSGKHFDSGTKSSFSMKGVIAGFSEGLSLMHEGAYYRLYIPPELGYGIRGSGSSIKPNTALIFDVFLSKVTPPPPPTE